jgi:hypothetical protein
MTKKLTLKSDRLHELAADDLRAVVGGLPTQVGPDSVFQCPELTGNYPTLPVYWCVTDRTG